MGEFFGHRYRHPASPGIYGGLVVRYDAEAQFAATASWSTFDVGSVNAAARGFAGATFDGQYVYLVPYSGSVVAGFEAKTVWSKPPVVASSF